MHVRMLISLQWRTSSRAARAFNAEAAPPCRRWGRTLSWLCPPDTARLSRASLAGLANCGTPCMCAYTQRGQLCTSCLEHAPCLGLHEGHR